MWACGKRFPLTVHGRDLRHGSGPWSGGVTSGPTGFACQSRAAPKCGKMPPSTRTVPYFRRSLLARSPS